MNIPATHSATRPDLPPASRINGGADTNVRVRIWRPADLAQSEIIHGDFTEHRFAPHEHTTWAIGWVTEGSNDFRRERQLFKAPAGTVCVVNPAEVHTGGGRHLTYWCLMPSPALLRLAFPEAEPSALCTTRAVIQEPAALMAVRRLFEAFRHGGDRLQRQEAAVAALHAVLGRGPVPPAAPKAGKSPLVAKAIEYLMENLHRQVSLEELGAAIGASSFQVCRAFAARVGISPGAFVRSRRVARAQRLIHSGRDLSSVAAACGFADQAHMTRLFRAVLGCTPAQWRGAA
jgi:AraC-like DNA-binding protein